MDKQDKRGNKNDDEISLPPLLVGVAGGSASGKSTLCEKIIGELCRDNSSFTVISLDSYYKGVEKGQDASDYNFDHPDALDWEEAQKNIEQLLKREETWIPIYCFKTHSRQKHRQKKEASDIILVEGILALYDEKIRNSMNYKIFVHCDDDIRLCRRMLRDVEERGRDVESILYQYNFFVKSSFDEFVEPTINYADIVVPSTKPNQVAIRFIVSNLKNMIEEYKNIKVYLNQKLLINFYDLIKFFQDFKTNNQDIHPIIYQDHSNHSYDFYTIFLYEDDRIN